MNCSNCKGTGTIKTQTKRLVPCKECRSTGQAVYLSAVMDGNGVKFAGEDYAPGVVLPYRNTAGKRAECVVDGFDVFAGFFNKTNRYPLYYYPLSDVLFTGVDTVTGAKVCRPLWRSITLRKKNELFEQNVAERV